MLWPRFVADWIYRGQTLREFKQRHKEAQRDEIWTFRDQVSLAKDYLERDSPDAARTVVLSLLDRYPDFALESQSLFQLLMRLKLIEQADGLMERGIRRFPRERRYLSGLAEVTEARGDHEKTLRLCARMRKLFPADFAGYGIAARQLGKTGDFEQAEKLLAEGLKLPDAGAGPAIEYARLPMLRKDWEVGLERWRVVAERFGHHGGSTGMAECLAHLKRFDEAEAILKAALPAHPLEPSIRAGLAHVLEARGDKAAALQVWDDIRQKFPMTIFGYQESVRLLRKTGQEPEAEAVRQAALERFPDLSI